MNEIVLNANYGTYRTITNKNTKYNITGIIGKGSFGIVSFNNELT
jgi:hypothetical protein